MGGIGNQDMLPPTFFLLQKKKPFGHKDYFVLII